MRLRELFFAVAALVAAAAVAGAAPQKPSPNPDAVLQKEFMDKVKEYDSVRNTVESGLPAVPHDADPAQIKQHEQALRRGLQRARRDAEPGDLFHKHTRALIRRLLAQALAQAGPEAKRAIEDDNPSAMASRLTIDGPYPDGLPVATVPPQVLDALPRLPVKDLEYRFVGRRLVLLDTRAKMVVDWVDNALPR